MKCDTCIFSRGIISENGRHSVCCLSESEARECITGTVNYFKTIERKEKTMHQPTGCKRKEKQTIASRLTTLRPAKRKASLKPVPKAFSIKVGMPPVYHQHYGNCTSNAVLGCDHYIYHRESPTWDPSTTFAYYCQKAADHDLKADDGSTVEMALKTTKKRGACSSKIWPNTEPWNKKPSPEAYENGLKGKEIKKWYILKSFKQMKQALSSGYPVAAAVAWCFKSIDPTTFVMNSPTDKEIDKCVSGHAIVIGGYDDTTKLVEFRNSWSDQWGNQGYGYMTYETFKRVIWWDDTYAVIK